MRYRRQAIGLARLGHRVHAAVLSPAAVARAEREATAAGVSLSFGVADMRELSEQVPGTFDVVVACDNALPHLLTDDDLRLATTNIARKLRPGGLFLASTRDYDDLIQTRPPSELPRVLNGPGGRRITFQVWEWSPDGAHYTVHQFLLRPDGQEWRTDHFETESRALLRDDLTAALHATGFERIHWHEPEVSRYYQPIVTARSE